MDQNKAQLEEAAEVLKALAHPVRLCIVKNLMEQQTTDVEPANVTQMQNCLGIPQSTLSQHLQKLRSAGVISGTRQGLEITYEVADPRVSRILTCFFDA